GHEIGNHTYSHPHLKNIGEKQLTEELKRTEILLKERFGYTPVLFRPPEGYCCNAVTNSVKRMKYELTLWDVDTTDWAHNRTDNIIKTVLASVKDGSIILCHDFVTKPSPTPEAIRTFIPKLKARGYDFVTVSELKKTDP
ncbi:MAG: polysaccharide deacetylase family protein, partial [Clostridia bacterium]|nr:polysaccharide deacetylase family protein [Clostridia bacterium]